VISAQRYATDWLTKAEFARSCNERNAPWPAWSTGDTLAVAVLLRDTATFAALDCTEVKHYNGSDTTSAHPTSTQRHDGSPKSAPASTTSKPTATRLRTGWTPDRPLHGWPVHATAKTHSPSHSRSQRQGLFRNDIYAASASGRPIELTLSQRHRGERRIGP
jgi:hypothetical protein